LAFGVLQSGLLAAEEIEGPGRGPPGPTATEHRDKEISRKPTLAGLDYAGEPGYRLKLRRAKQHLDAIYLEGERFIKNNPRLWFRNSGR
jgi:hypothetical protein